MSHACAHSPNRVCAIRGPIPTLVVRVKSILAENASLILHIRHVLTGTWARYRDAAF